MDQIVAGTGGAVIASPRHDGLSLRLILRDAEADDCAVDFIGGLRWPFGTSVRLADQRASERPQALDARTKVLARLGRAGIRVVDETRSNAKRGSGRRNSTDLMITGGSRSSGGLRQFVAQSLAEREGPMLIARRPELARGLVVVDDGVSPSLIALLRREPFRRAHFRVLGVVDMSVPLPAGLTSSPAGVLPSGSSTTAEAHLFLETATRQVALALSWAGVASAQVEEGNAEQIILRVARDMAADWVVLARAVDGSNAVLSLVDRLVGNMSILISPTMRPEA